ncbi:MAG TPA: acyl-CoA dehydrogenase, partial [Vicinamibacteria bacterium]|nr:acyl-CoA dehydrogenase [Vicinamibacteria bacterium]
RITTIYEGTSEIMEWTIARDRWQLHLKSRGEYYKEWAKKAEARHAQNPNVGASHAAVALRALAALLERARLDKLTRNQHLLFRLGELIAYGETAANFAERAACRPTNASGLQPATLQAMARIHAREAVLKVASDGLRWANGAGQSDPGLARALQLEAAFAAQAGLVEDMDRVAADLSQAFPAK